MLIDQSSMTDYFKKQIIDLTKFLTEKKIPIVVTLYTLQQPTTVTGCFAV